MVRILSQKALPPVLGVSEVQGNLGTSRFKEKSLQRAHSSAWLERFPDKEEVGGSSPPGPTRSNTGT